MTCKEMFEREYEGSPHDIKACPVDFGWGVGYPEYCCEGSNDDICEECWNREIPEQKKMTCLQKLAIEHPDKIRPDMIGGASGCPSHYGYLEDPVDDLCKGAYCETCWNREFPGYTIEEKANREFLQEVELENEKVNKICEVGNPNPIPPQELKKALGILDSGDRTEFSSGAVRDMHAGKGRFDVMPMYVVANILNSPVLERIAGFRLTGNTAYLYQAIEHFTIDCYGNDAETDTLTQLSATMLLEVAKHYEEGAIKYEPDNWRKSIPVWCYIDSATRHYVKWRRGDTDEHHERAFVWNLMCCIWEVDYGKEWRKQKAERIFQ